MADPSTPTGDPPVVRGIPARPLNDVQVRGPPNQRGVPLSNSAHMRDKRATYAGGESRPPMDLPAAFDTVPGRRKIQGVNQQNSPLDTYQIDQGRQPPRRPPAVIDGPGDLIGPSRPRPATIQPGSKPDSNPLARSTSSVPVESALHDTPPLARSTGSLPSKTEAASNETFAESVGNWFGWGARAEKEKQQELARAEHEKQQEYDRMLAEATSSDFSDLEKFGFLYTSGYDKEGRPIIVFLASRVPAKIASLERILLYILKVLDPIVVKDYSILYVHTGFRSENQPPFTFLKRCYGVFRRQYKKNLKCVMIVQPTFWVRGCIQFVRPFVSDKFWKKLHFAEDINQINDCFGTGVVKLPDGLIKSLATTETSQTPPTTPVKATTPAPLEPPKPQRHDIFGVDLIEVMNHPMNASLPMPLVFISCVKYLRREGMETVGLFRVPGNKNLMGDVKSSFDNGIAVDLFDPELCLDSADVGGVLKQYIRELPNPLLQHELYAKWVTAIGPDVPTNVATIKYLISQLPFINQWVLGSLIHLLKSIADSSAINKMTPQNLAIVWGPNLLRGKDTSAASELLYTGQINTITVLLVTRCLEFFPVDPMDLLEEASKPGTPQPLKPQTQAPELSTPSPGDLPPPLPGGTGPVVTTGSPSGPPDDLPPDFGPPENDPPSFIPPPAFDPPTLPPASDPPVFEPPTYEPPVETNTVVPIEIPPVNPPQNDPFPQDPMTTSLVGEN